MIRIVSSNYSEKNRVRRSELLTFLRSDLPREKWMLSKIMCHLCSSLTGTPYNLRSMPYQLLFNPFFAFENLRCKPWKYCWNSLNGVRAQNRRS